MTNAEFQQKLQDMYLSHTATRHCGQKTLNELVFALRMSGELYQLNYCTSPDHDNMICVPDVEQTFIPVRDLAMKVVNVYFDEDIYNECGVQLLYIELEKGAIE